MVDILSFRMGLIEEIRKSKREYKNYYQFLEDFNKNLIIYKVEITPISESVEVIKNELIINKGGLELLPTEILIDIFYKTLKKIKKEG